MRDRKRLQPISVCKVLHLSELAGRCGLMPHDVCRANEYRDVFQAMAGKHSGAMIQHLLYKLLVDLVRDDIKALLPHGNVKSVPAEALVQFVAGGLFGLLKWWLDGKMRLSVEELNTLFRQLAIPAMKAALL